MEKNSIADYFADEGELGHLSYLVSQRSWISTETTLPASDPTQSTKKPRPSSPTTISLKIKREFKPQQG